MWKEGRIHDLMQEFRTIQKRLSCPNTRKPKDNARIFANLMIEGKTKAALKFLTKDCENGILDLSDDVMVELQKIHPDPSPINTNSLLNGPIENIPVSYFDAIDESMIHNAARLTKGAGGPS